MLPEVLTIYNDLGGRTRRSPAYSLARFDWLERWRSNLGEGPYLAARAAFVSHMSSDRPPRALHEIGVAFSRGAIPLWRAVYYAVSLAIPAVRKYAVIVKESRLRRRENTSVRGGVCGKLEKSAKANPSHGLFH
jgi:hypothetical protein